MPSRPSESTPSVSKPDSPSSSSASGATVTPAAFFISAASSSTVICAVMRLPPVLLGVAGAAPQHERRVRPHEPPAQHQRRTQLGDAGAAGHEVEVVADVE